MDNFNVYGVWRDAARIAFDAPPEVFDAIALNRASLVGKPASTADMLWALSSPKELLILADYYGQVNPPGFAPTGLGETMRLNSVAFSRQDPHGSSSGHWAAVEYAQYINYLAQVAPRASCCSHRSLAL